MQKMHLSDMKQRLNKLWWGLGSFCLAAVLLLATAQMTQAAEEELLAEDLSTSTKTAAQSEVIAGGIVAYTVALHNTGNTPVVVSITDTLPAELTLLNLSTSAGVVSSEGNIITGSMAINPAESVMVYYTAEVTATAVVGSLITNTIEIVGGSTHISRTATVGITDATADYSGSSKTASRTGARRGQTIHYTLVISNSGTLNDSVTVTDTFPTHLSLVGTPTSTAGGTFTPTGNQLIWTGGVSATTAVTLSYSAAVGNSAPIGAVLTNEAVIVGTGDSVTVEDSVTVLTSASKAYLPLIVTPLPVLEISTTRPNSSNSWTLSWTGGSAGLSYEVQESQTADFAAVTTLNPGTQTSQAVQRTASIHNVTYYRVRPISGSLIGDWSNAVRVVSAYEDEFTDNVSNWKIRRTTFINEVNGFYENSQNGFGHSWYVIRIEDPRDWGIASPLAEAPEPPYVIEYRIQTPQPGNLISAGAVFGGDWNGVPEPAGCINYSTLATVYEHTDCFNQFYFANIILHNGVKMLFERVDQLVWCPTCTGSPMKRFGDISSSNEVTLPGLNPADFNTYRYEVRADGIKVFVNGTQRFTYSDLRYLDQPYFGIGATTDEYSNSTWRMDYYRVTPLD